MTQASSSVSSPPASLHRSLSGRQLMMIVIGSSIGTGLFLGSGLAIHMAGPAVILAYLFCSALALIISWALAEMAVVDPSAGSLGLFAGKYLNPWAGYVVAVSYWACAVISIGQEIVASSIYCQYWFPNLPRWIIVAGFAVCLVWVNSWNVGKFGEFEYWFAMIKVATIISFIIFSVALLMGLTNVTSPKISHYTLDGGFMPTGWRGLWFSVPFALISFIGIEMISVTSGEVQNPGQAIPRASKAIVWRLILFYVLSVALLVAIAPWRAIGISVSPFVYVFQAVHLPAAPGIMNFVVLTAALSGANSSLYGATRMLYSMSQHRLVPGFLGRVSRKGVPLPALLGSAVGLVIAVIAALLIPAQAFMFMIAAAYFQIMLVWILILLSYLSFRKSTSERQHKALIGHPYTTCAAIGVLVAIVATTWWIPSMKVTIITGAIWMAALTGYYYIAASRFRGKLAADAANVSSISARS